MKVYERHKMFPSYEVSYAFYQKHPFQHVVWLRSDDHECTQHYGDYLPEHWNKLNRLGRNQIIVMGRKTFEANKLSEGFPDRMLFVLSRTKRDWIVGNKNRPKVAFFLSVEDLLRYQRRAFPYTSLLVVGGMQTFASTWDQTGIVHVTEVKHTEEKVGTYQAYPYLGLCKVEYQEKDFMYEENRHAKGLLVHFSRQGYQTKHAVYYRQ